MKKYSFITFLNILQYVSVTILLIGCRKNTPPSPPFGNEPYTLPVIVDGLGGMEYSWQTDNTWYHLDFKYIFDKEGSIVLFVAIADPKPYCDEIQGVQQSQILANLFSLNVRNRRHLKDWNVKMLNGETKTLPQKNDKAYVLTTHYDIIETDYTINDLFTHTSSGDTEVEGEMVTIPTVDLKTRNSARFDEFIKCLENNAFVMNKKFLENTKDCLAE